MIYNIHNHNGCVLFVNQLVPPNERDGNILFEVKSALGTCTHFFGDAYRPGASLTHYYVLLDAETETQAKALAIRAKMRFVMAGCRGAIVLFFHADWDWISFSKHLLPVTSEFGLFAYHILGHKFSVLGAHDALSILF